MVTDSTIKAAFFDVDGTLLSFDTHRVPPSAQAALRCLHDRGVRIFIASGRASTNPAGFDKGTALCEVARYLDVSQSATMACRRRRQ